MPAPPLEPITLTGTHVVLAPLEADDVDALYAAVGAPVLWALGSTPMRDRHDMAAYVERQLSSEHDLSWKTLDARTGEIIGCTNLHQWSAHDRSGEIGTTRIAVHRQGTGANTEAKYLQLRYAFETLSAHRIGFRTDTRNERSQAALRKIGATFEGVHRRHMVLHDGYVRDSAWFSITDEEWPGVKQRLESLLASGA